MEIDEQARLVRVSREGLERLPHGREQFTELRCGGPGRSCGGGRGGRASAGNCAGKFDLQPRLGQTGAHLANLVLRLLEPRHEIDALQALPLESLLHFPRSTSPSRRRCFRAKRRKRDSNSEAPVGGRGNEWPANP